MKKRFSAEATIILFLCLLFSSCTSTEDASLYYSYAQYAQAADAYALAAAHTKDKDLQAKLIYNQALSLAQDGNWEGAASIAKEAQAKWPDKVEFAQAELVYRKTGGDLEACCEILLSLLEKDEKDSKSRLELAHNYLGLGQTENAYAQALILWEQKVFSKEVATILHEGEPERWQVVFDALSSTEK